jgi:hypothetical protein
MKIASAWSSEQDVEVAVARVCDAVKQRLGGEPTAVFVHHSVRHDPAVVAAAFRARFGGAAVLGGTSCLGVMTEEGAHVDDGIGLGVLAVHDPEGSYGVAVQPIGGDPRKASAEAIARAIAAAGRPGEPPELVWVVGVPGHEERLLLGIQDVIGGEVPIAGGSAADNDVSGKWQLFAGGEPHREAVAVCALYPSRPVHYAFHSGYTPTERSATVTRADGRVLHELDGRPAAEVYNEWTDGSVAAALPAGGNVLGGTTLHPLGRVVGEVGGEPYYRLSHPDAVTPERGLSLFTDIHVGEKVVLMQGTRSSLVSRAGRVARVALADGHLAPEQVAGALVVYCAGCMLTVRDELDKVAGEVRAALGGKPFLGTFTFGEQGCFVGGENHHGNLMISVVVFEV